jgi:hypothetical protein
VMEKILRKILRHVVKVTSCLFTLSKILSHLFFFLCNKVSLLIIIFLCLFLFTHITGVFNNKLDIEKAECVGERVYWYN